MSCQLVKLMCTYFPQSVTRRNSTSLMPLVELTLEHEPKKPGGGALLRGGGYIANSAVRSYGTASCSMCADSNPN